MATITVAELYERHCPGKLKNKCRGVRGLEKCGPCPSCGGKDRFTVYMDQDGGKGSYTCYQCKRAGDVIQFLRDFESMSFGDACKAAGRDAPPLRSCPRAPEGTQATQAGIVAEEARPVAGPLWVEKATLFAQWAFEQLMGTPKALAWLAGRGLPLEAVVRYRLGYNPGEKGKPGIIRARKGWGLADEQARQGAKPKTTLWLPRGLVIPCWAAEQAQRLRIRRPEADRSEFLPDLKYFVVPGSGMAPLWLEQRGGIMAGACAVVVEAELDALAVHHAAGEVCAVLGAGTAQIRRLPASVMRRLGQCAVILVATDIGDESEAGRKGWELWRETFPQARRWPCVGGKDPGEMVAVGRDILPWVLAGLPDGMYRAVVQALRHKEADATGAETGAETESTDGTAGPSAPSPAAPSCPLLVSQDTCQAEQPERAVLVREDGTPETEGDRIRAEREFLPLTHIYYGGPSMVQKVLKAHGLNIQADGNVSGHERWSLERLPVLFFFLRRHRAALDALAACAPAAAQA